MNLAAWKVFIEAVERGSLSKVALAHGTSQPQVSRIIAELEAECGGRLFQRNGRGVVLTDLGARIVPQVRTWIDSTEQFINDVKSAAGTPTGRVRIGSLPSTAHPLITAVTRQLKARYPLVQLAVREGQGSQLETWLEDGSVDLAILFRTSPTPRGGDIYLSEAPTYLVGAPRDRLLRAKSIEFAALDGLPLVLFCRPNSWRNHIEQTALERDVALNVVMEADSLNLQTNIASAGDAYALLGPQAIANASKVCRLGSARIVAPTVNRYVALAQSPRGKTSLAIQAVTDLIRSASKAETMAR